jgi:DNA-binding ferritin-like protein (Dps family)
MKIIITEKQLKLIGLIKENENVLNQFNSRISSLNNTLNKFYTHINFISLAELLNGEIDIKIFVNKISQLNDEYHKISKDMYRYFNSSGEDVYFEKWATIHDNLDGLNNKNYDKINVISSILETLETLVNNNGDAKNLFSDIKSIDLQ